MKKNAKIAIAIIIVVVIVTALVLIGIFVWPGLPDNNDNTNDDTNDDTTTTGCTGTGQGNCRPGQRCVNGTCVSPVNVTCVGTGPSTCGNGETCVNSRCVTLSTITCTGTGQGTCPTIGQECVNAVCVTPARVSCTGTNQGSCDPNQVCISNICYTGSTQSTTTTTVGDVVPTVGDVVPTALNDGVYLITPSPSDLSIRYVTYLSFDSSLAYTNTKEQWYIRRVPSPLTNNSYTITRVLTPNLRIQANNTAPTITASERNLFTSQNWIITETTTTGEYTMKRPSTDMFAAADSRQRIVLSTTPTSFKFIFVRTDPALNAAEEAAISRLVNLREQAGMVNLNAGNRFLNNL